jgi:outer membrane protein assembly factor BamB
MRKITTLFILIALLSISINALAITWTSYALVDGVRKGYVKASNPVFSPDGNTIYIPTSTPNGHLFAVNRATGAINWVFEITALTYGGGAVVGSDGTIYQGARDKKVYAINPNGTQKWATAVLAGNFDAFPALSKDGSMIYYLANGTTNSTLYAINTATGASSWSNTITGTTGGAVAIDDAGNVYAGTNSKIIKYNAAGTSQWETAAGSHVVTESGSFAIDSERNTLYAARKLTAGIAALNMTDGTTRWTRASGGDAYFPIVGPDGTVYFTEKLAAGKAYAINPDGSDKWTSLIGVTLNYCGLVLGDNGKLYGGTNAVSGSLFEIFSLDVSNGVKTTLLQTEHQFSAPASIGPDNKLYIGSIRDNIAPSIEDNGRLFVLDINAGREKNSWSMRGRNLSGNSVAGTKLTAPTVGTASGITISGFTANWTAVANASSYDVVVYQGATAISTTNFAGQSTSSGAIIGLLASTTYTYKVKAKTGSEDFYDSNLSVASAAFSTQAIGLKLDTPTASSASAITTTGFTANWTAVDDATSYNVAVYQGTTSISTTNFSGQATTSGAVIGLTSGVTYSYTVTALDETLTFDASDASNAIAVTTQVQLATPTVGAAYAFTADGFTANWTALANAVSYDVALYEEGVLKSTSNAAGQATESYIFSALTAGLNYTYTVTAIGNGTTHINSVASAQSTAVITLTPGLLIPFDIRPTGLTAYWKTTVNATGYTVRVYQGGDMVAEVTETGQTATSTVITGLHEGLPYTYTVTSSDGYTSASSGVITTLKPHLVENFQDWTAQSTVGTYSFTKTIYNGSTAEFTSNNLRVQPTQAVNVLNFATGHGRPTNGRILINTNTNYFNFPQLSGVSTVTIKQHPGTVNNGYKLQSSLDNSNWSDVPNSTVNLPNITAVAITIPVNNAGNVYIRLNPTSTVTINIWDVQVNPFVSSTKLASPTVLAASGVNSSAFTANWEAVTNALGYYIKVYQNGNYVNTTYIDGQASENGKITGLSPNTSYTYKAIARGDVTTNASSDASVASSSFTTLELVNVTVDTDVSEITLTELDDILVASGAKLTINQAKTVNSVTLAPGAKLNVNAALTATLTLESDATATATLVDSYSVPTINATVQQYLPQGRNWYVASPIESTIAPALANGLTVSGAATSVSYYDETQNGTSNDWVNNYNGNLLRGVGYVAVSNSGTGTNKIELSGTLNSGNVPVTLTRTGTGGFAGYNLIANPYPSYINPMTAISALNVEKTIWYRTKGSTYKFETVNTTTGVGTDAALSGNAVTGYIPPLQAFWVRTNVNNVELVFTNSMRTHANPVVGETTINTTALKAPKQQTNSIARINISGNAGNDQAVLYFNASASNGFDDFDSRKMLESVSATTPEIYLLADAEKVAINGMQSIPYNTEIPLGFIVKQTGDFSISRTEFSNFESGTRILLKDKIYPSTEFELAEDVSYNFSSQTTTATTDRFSLVFRAPGVATSIDNAGKLNTQVFVNAQNQITIIAPEKTTYNIYNAVGQQIENGQTTTKLQTVNCKLSSGAYFVALKVNGQREIQKIIIR